MNYWLFDLIYLFFMIYFSFSIYCVASSSRACFSNKTNWFYNYYFFLLVISRLKKSETTKVFKTANRVIFYQTILFVETMLYYFFVKMPTHRAILDLDDGIISWKWVIATDSSSEACNCIKHLSNRSATVCISIWRTGLRATNQPCSLGGKKGLWKKSTIGRERERETQGALGIINFHYRKFAN